MKALHITFVSLCIAMTSSSHSRAEGLSDAANASAQLPLVSSEAAEPSAQTSEPSPAPAVSVQHPHEGPEAADHKSVTDDWAKAIDRGRTQERVNETDEERERRDDRVIRESGQLERQDSAARRVHVVVYVSTGWLWGHWDFSGSRSGTDSSLGQEWMTGWTLGGPVVGAALGARFGLNRRFDIQARADYLQQVTNETREVGITSYPSFLVLDATLRIRPVVGSGVYVGVGGRIGAFFTGIEVATADSVRLDDDGPWFNGGAIVEFGVVMGDVHPWDIALRGGVSSVGQDNAGGIVTLSAGWSLI